MCGVLVRDNYVEDLEYEPKNLMELLDPSLHNWVHHVLNILPQVTTLYCLLFIIDDRC